jgi:hypothetical protein
MLLLGLLLNQPVLLFLVLVPPPPLSLPPLLLLLLLLFLFLLLPSCSCMCSVPLLLFSLPPTSRAPRVCIVLPLIICLGCGRVRVRSFVWWWRWWWWWRRRWWWWWACRGAVALRFLLGRIDVSREQTPPPSPSPGDLGFGCVAVNVRA